MLEKALELKTADAIIFDLEDSVVLQQKSDARAKVTNALNAVRAYDTDIEIMVRINSFSSEYALDDLIEISKHRPDAIIIPKATRETVSAAGIMLSVLELKYALANKCIGIIPLIEKAVGIQDIYGILQSSDRIVAAQFGAEDFTNEMEIERTKGGLEIAHSRNVMAVACRASKVACIDTPYVNYKDLEGCRKDTEYAKSVGMTGRTIIHPALIDLTNEIFSPSESETENARRIIEVYEEAAGAGKGAVSLNSKMIDAPVVERARKLLEKAT